MIEYDCAECGWHVIRAADRAPDPLLCAECAWIAEHILPDDQPMVRQRLGLMRQQDSAIWQWDGLV